MSGALQVPHWITFPQPSPSGPQFEPISAQVLGLHGPVPPQTLKLPPPPHVSGAVHVPQSSSPPHPSPVFPQVYPSLAQVNLLQLPAPLSDAFSRPASTKVTSPPASVDPKPAPPVLPHAETTTPTKNAPIANAQAFMALLSRSGIRGRARAVGTGVVLARSTARPASRRSHTTFPSGARPGPAPRS
jgi:hypothetical protein